LVAHYYVDGDLRLALETGGCVADSLEMARFGRDHAAQTLVVAGVRFMGETSKILSPAKRVLMPDLEATCSLDLGCPPDEFARFCDAHADRKVVVYANTSAAVKARADWMVTSSCALAIVQHLHEQGHKILWAPTATWPLHPRTDRRRHAAVECRMHRATSSRPLELEVKAQYRRRCWCIQSPAGVVALADVVGSTSQLVKAVVEGVADTYIVATDNGILHRMRPAPGDPARSATASNGDLQKLPLPVDGDECCAGLVDAAAGQGEIGCGGGGRRPWAASTACSTLAPTGDHRPAATRLVPESAAPDNKWPVKAACARRSARRREQCEAPPPVPGVEMQADLPRSQPPRTSRLCRRVGGGRGIPRWPPMPTCSPTWPAWH
jgi:quinolinate synthetase A subunit